MTRVLLGVLAAFYALQSTWLLHAGFDALFPRVALLVTPDACCAAACGCPAEVVARGDCCCGPSAKPTSPKTATASGFDIARCSGLELAMAQAVNLPALDVFPRVEAAPPRVSRLTLPDFTPDVDPRVLDLDKVPL
ncbi:MAG TPA: hypothetical protein VF950_17975 [Planctomycetota bacterium]